ncbi:MAG TPA: metallophosphoesterase family protein [Solirubrobacteraceae bacterium]|nr:metallophosphoesterase family protein [Solirubrobacteraceae bacterium]
MLLAIVSDTHLPRANRRLPERCVAQLRRSELILHAGDVSTAAALEDIARIGPPVKAVHGNVDEPALQRRLPAALELELDGVAIAMTHDAGPARGRLARMRARFPRAAVVIFGHSHIPLHEHDGHGFQIFNPGSPTERRRAPQHTMGLATVRDGRVALELVVV